MPKLFKAISSLLSAFRLCLFDRRYRRLAMRPWLIGIVVYCGAIVGAYYTHGPLLHRAIDDPTGIWTWVVYIFVWIAVTFGLLISTMIVSVTVILIFSSLFQTDLAKLALSDLQIPYPEDTGSLAGTAKETARTIFVETAKLLWLIPLGIVAFITGLFPILLPITLVLISWLLSYQFADIVLDVLRISPFRRLRYSVRHLGTMLWFGLALATLWAVPFLGFLLPPIAVVAAAHYFKQTGFLDRIGAIEK